MCTKAEVRSVVKDAVVPSWARAVLSAAIMGAMTTLGWSAIKLQQQTDSISSLEKSSAIRDTELNGQINTLISEFNNLKDVTVNRSKHRDDLIDERCENIRKQVFENSVHIHDLEKKISNVNVNGNR